MYNILYIGPDVKGRYKGGIMSIYNTIKDANTNNTLKFDNINIQIFNSHKLKQSKNSEGKFKIENILQALTLYKRLFIKLLFNKYDLIHFNTSAKIPLLKDLIILKLLYPLIKSDNIVLHIHMCGIEDVINKNKLLKTIEIYLLKKMNLIVLSNTFKSELVSINFDSNRIHYLPNFHSNKYIIKQENSFFEENKLSLIFIGSISKRKGFLDLLNALKDIKISYELNVLGEFESLSMKSNCEKIINDSKLNVIFHGYKIGVEKEIILRASQIMILPSYAEGFPMVIPEAFSYGLVVIATNISSIPEIIVSNCNGFIYNPGDLVSLKNILENLYYYPESMNKVRENAFLSANYYTFENHIKILNKIYNQILYSNE